MTIARLSFGSLASRCSSNQLLRSATPGTKPHQQRVLFVGVLLLYYRYRIVLGQVVGWF